MKIIHFPCLLALLAVWSSTIQKLKAQNTSPFILTQSNPGENAHETSNWHLLQDRHGNIWTMTQSGISKFDGSSFKSHSTLVKGLVESSYTKAFESSNGQIWFVGIGGKLSFYENGKFHAYEYGGQIEKFLSNDKCVSFHSDSNGVLHFGTFRNGYFRILPNGDVLNPASENNSPSGIYFTRIEGQYFVFGISSSKKYDHLLPVFSFKTSGNHEKVTQLYKDTITSKKEHFPRIRFASFTNGDLIISKNHRLAIVTKDTVEIHKTDACMTGLMVDGQDGIWLSGVKSQGVLYYPNRNLSVENEQLLLPKTIVHHVIEDEQKGIWFGTDTSGLLHMPFRRITRLKTKDLKRWKAIDRPDLVKNAKAILLAAKKPGLFSVYDGENLHEITIDTDKLISAQYLDKEENTLFLATKTSIFVFKTDDASKNKKLEIDFKGWVRSIIPKNNGDGLWIAAGQRVHSFSKNRIEKSLPTLPYQIVDLCESDSFLFAATVNGLWKFENGRWIDQSPKNGRINGLITHLSWYKERLWIFGFLHGLTVHSNGKFHAISGDHNTEINSVHCSFKTDSSLQFVTINGQFFSIFPLKDDKYHTTLSPTPHLFTPHTYTIQSINTMGNHLLFESHKDVFLYSYEGDYPTPNISMRIDSIMVNGVARPFSDVLVLPHDSNTITFHFSLKSYHSRGLNNFAYKMSKIDSLTYTNQKSLRYNTLPKGRHTFEVYAANDFFQFTQNHTVAITILPHYYETWWFRMGIASLAGLLIFTGFRLRLQRIKRKGELLEELHGSQYQALAARMNPHFLFNSLSAIHEFTLNNPKEVLAEYISDYALLMRKVLENSGQNVVSLKTELETISLYIKMENLRCNGKIQYSMEIMGKIDLEHTEVPTALFQPYLENAIWHGLAPKKSGRAELKLKIERDGKGLLLCIEDNGIGRKASAQIGTSNHMGFDSQGTDITEKRIQLMNSLYGSRITVETIDLVGEDSEPSGTLVRIRIPG